MRRMSPLYAVPRLGLSLLIAMGGTRAACSMLQCDNATSHLWGMGTPLPPRAEGLNPDSKVKLIILVNEPVLLPFFFFPCTEAGDLGPMCEQLYINVFFCTWFTRVGVRRSI